jgi:dihydrofolate reductase
MRNVTYSMNLSLDGYIVGPDGGFDWSAPDQEVFRFWIDEIRQVGVHLLGRRLYETMLYWETAEQDRSLDDAELEWAALWKPLPKVVFSTTLSEVQGNARLASGGLAEEIERLRDDPGEGEIAIGGATLAAEAAALGLIDEYRAMVYPVLVGGGIPFLSPARAPGRSRTRGDQHLQLEIRVPPLPRAALANWDTTRASDASLHPPEGRIDGPNGPMGHWRSGDAPEWNDPADDVVRYEEESWQISRSARSSMGP